MKIDLGVLGKVQMEELVEPCKYEQGRITHSGHTEQGIRVHIFLGYGWHHGEMWNNAIMLDVYDVHAWEAF